jgi:phage tail sheath protein FI
MATTYLAPGVYVEEVPSAQQPIAGVGTNTVGFLGVVPDVIYYPEPNPDYDPVLAQGVLRLATLIAQRDRAPEAERPGIQREIQDVGTRLQNELRALEADIDTLDKTIADLRESEPNALSESDRAEILDKIDEASRERQRKVDEKTDLEDRISRESTLPAQPAQPAQPASPAQPAQPTQPSPELNEAELLKASVLKPYVLKKFEVHLHVNEFDTKLCTNFTEYTNLFGTFPADFPELDPARKAEIELYRALTHAVSGFFRNGGTRCFVARIKDQSLIKIRRALDAFESIDAIAIIAAPGFDRQEHWSELVAHCENTKDRFAILDCPATVEADGKLDEKLLSYESPGNVLPQRNKNAAFYFPWIEVVDPAKQIQDQDPARAVPTKYWGRLYVPPSGHIAGIYARTDEERGVHKAPANSAILGALNVKYYISKQRQGVLNPQGVNCIRNINGNITVWGARTIGGDKNGEWKYINVRRLFLFLSESIDEGTQWVVFEPNDPALWGKIRRNVSAFLTNVWRSGALFGLTPEEAFYVKCDAETNPPEVRDLGMVVTEIGVAIVRPAEFVIFRVTQAIGPRTV